MILHRVLGALLLAAMLLPGHRLLEPTRTGLAGAQTRAATEAVWGGGLLGGLFVVVVAALLARLGAPTLLLRRVERWTEGMARVPPGSWALTLGALSFSLAAAVALLLLGGRPTSVDAMVQLLHAQALRAGEAALDLPGPPAAWLVQNGVLTGAGWASVYPPGHTAVLALGLGAGAAWLVGPLGAATAAGLTALGLDRLLIHHRGVARWAGLTVALSPFLLLLGGTHLSHTTAAALSALVLWSALRARDGHPAWSLLVGGAVGALVCTRPWTGLALGTALPLAVWLPGPVRRLPVLGGGVILGGLPFAAILLSWNAHLFGHPLRLGYTAAFGPGHGLGFHTDPWGNRYGVVEALGYTGSDLLLLGTHLLETPLPALALVGLALLVTPRLLPGAGPLLVWGFAPLLANAFYWHHGMHLGPRLLYESAPAWAALTAVSAAALLRQDLVPRWRAAVSWTLVLSVVGAATLVPGRLASAADGARASAAVEAPQAQGGQALILVHGSWSSRVAARLAATGMRRDSVETALRRNDLCRVQVLATAREEGGTVSGLELEPLPGSPPTLRPVEISPGNRVLLDPARTLTPECTRQARADATAGTLELEPLLWRTPPLSGRGTLVARDLGPEGNRDLLEAHPGRTPWLLVSLAGGGVRLLPYGEAMARVWGVRDGG